MKKKKFGERKRILKYKKRESLLEVKMKLIENIEGTK